MNDVYEISKDGVVIARFSDEKTVAAFFFGIYWVTGSKDTIIDYNVSWNGCAVLKTLIINKYFPKN